MAERLLVVLTGPVGAGKSTVAVALADCLRCSGRTAAVIDVEVVYCMARQLDGFHEPDAWRVARRAAAALADVFFASKMDVVIVEGEFFSAEEHAELSAHLASEVAERFITLVVSFEEVWRRVQEDWTRGMSRDRDFLARLHVDFVEALPFLEVSSVLVEADSVGPRELAQRIADALLAGSGTDAR